MQQFLHLLALATVLAGGGMKEDQQEWTGYVNPGATAFSVYYFRQ
jgi:hypothetical protein